MFGKFWTSDKTVSACVGNSSRFRHFWQREEGATLVMDFPVTSQWIHILRHLHQRCSEYKKTQKAMKSWVSCRGSMWIYWPRFFVFCFSPLPDKYGLCRHTYQWLTLLSCTAGVPMELARLMQKWKGHWRRMAVLFTQFIGWTTETEHRTQKQERLVDIGIGVIWCFTFLTRFQTMAKYVAQSQRYCWWKKSCTTWNIETLEMMG